MWKKWVLKSAIMQKKLREIVRYLFKFFSPDESASLVA